MNTPKICLLGGDLRQLSLAQTLCERGCECALWGVRLPDAESAPSGGFPGVRCADAASAVSGSRAVVLPLPATTDGVRVHCPMPDPDLPEVRHELRLTHLFSLMPRGVPLLAGRAPEVLRAMARDARVPLIDYYDCEEVQIRNSVPTAEGALALVLRELPVTIFGTSFAVLGYGRVGRRLSESLRALGASVTVAARSEEQLAWARLSGCRAVPLAEYLAAPPPCAAVFNTIPAPIVPAAYLDALPPEAVYIELASAPGGLESGAAKSSGRRILRAPSLPGKTAPRTAGQILGDAVVHILEKEGVLA